MPIKCCSKPIDALSNIWLKQKVANTVKPFIRCFLDLDKKCLSKKRTSQYKEPAVNWKLILLTKINFDLTLVES